MDREASVHSPAQMPSLVTLSLQEIAKFSLIERKKFIAPYISAMADDFANDPVMTEFSVFDHEDLELD